MVQGSTQADRGQEGLINMGIVLVAGWYIVLPVAVFVDYYLSFPFWDGLATVNIIWSICLYFWFAGNLVLASKVPLVEKWLPYDRRVRLHIATGLAIMVALVWHVLSKFIGGVLVDWLSWVLLFGCGFCLLLSVAWTKMPVLGFLRSILGSRWARLSDRLYDGLRRVHSLGFAALVALSWWHIHEAGIDVMGISGLNNAYWLAAVLALSLYALSWLRKLLAVRGKVVGVEARDDLVLLDLQLTRPLRYRPGQFAYLRFPGQAGLQSGHPFSFLSSPGLVGRSASLRFGVKPQGDFTKALATLQAGATVQVNGPYGNFRPNPRQKSLLIGTGIGAVPILSLLAGYGDDQANWQAIVAVAKTDDLPVRPKGANVTLLDYANDGRLIDRPLLQGLMADSPDWHVWICSSPKLRQILSSELMALGVRRRRIHFEAFGFD